ncbi:uncharacterized protein RAG0_01630 [Rhynchosporium agropyri]|uniref:Heterokaryon incompatibility domain-containing protein n=1 Tax=Rhynchosporium agropyri TaxID=914238 RepID=A0A1E1JXF8_9HELO|nr:uncharacterized protein RAG0_01630 [Rhynchosporium agropyri]
MWLKTCLESHGSICRAQLSKLPFRLLDTGHANTSIISIHISKDEFGECLALSHCWGNCTQTSLTKEANISARRNGFPLSTIPKSFRDAVMITRTLGYRYLWIDCLCILQDFDKDWRKEFVNMAEIYANSVLTICADAAAGPIRIYLIAQT